MLLKCRDNKKARAVSVLCTEWSESNPD